MYKEFDEHADIVKFCVEFGASTGGSTSPTFPLVEKQWEALWIEYDNDKYKQLIDHHSQYDIVFENRKVTPDNIISILDSNGVPPDLGVLTIDIDGYDYFVLDKILSEYHPSIIIAEVNEKIPPPIKFTVLYDDKYSWAGNHFYGVSISKLDELCKKYDYSIVRMPKENAILVSNDINKNEKISASDVYERDYKSSVLARDPESYNANVMSWLDEKNPDIVMEWINEFFKDYAGKYSISQE